MLNLKTKTCAFALFLLASTNVCLSNCLRIKNVPQKRHCIELMSARLSRDVKNQITIATLDDACDRQINHFNTLKDAVNRTIPLQEHVKAYFDALGDKSPKARFKKLIRKDIRMLTNEERERYHKAVTELMRTPVGSINAYFAVVQAHMAGNAYNAHFGASFWGWHREFLYRFEQALRQIDDSVSIPYFDTTMDGILGEDAVHAITWSDDFYGTGEGMVTTGPYAYWPLMLPYNGSNYLTRDTGGKRTFTDQDLNWLLTKTKSFRDIVFFVNPQPENLHGDVHFWVGGVMKDVVASVGDPSFWGHHGFIDCAWEWMREVHAAAGVDIAHDYPNDTQALGLGYPQLPDFSIPRSPNESVFHALHPMSAMPELLNIEGHSKVYADRLYECAPRPHCSANDLDCGSPYLFCEITQYHCAPKLKIGAPCRKFQNSNPCYESVCCNGVCKTSCVEEENVQK